MATLAEMLRQGADRLVNLPSEAQRFITNPQAFTQLLTGKNPLPRETGFAAGATGLQAQEMSVLDPNQAPYMQGYSQGEPVSYAAMATPFAIPAVKALAPKANQMAENYMFNQGMMPSIVPPSPTKVADALRQPEKNALGFYSPLDEAVMNLQNQKGTGQQYLAQLLKTQGVKQEEVATRGLDTFLGQNPKVTKTQIEDFLGQNPVKLKETTLAEPKNEWQGNFLMMDKTAVAKIEENAEGRYVLRDTMTNKVTPLEANQLDQAVKQAEELYGVRGDVTPYGGKPKFGDYTLPNGENYREVLIQYPNEAKPAVFPKQAELDAVNEQLAQLKKAGNREEYGQLIGTRTDLNNERKAFMKQADYDAGNRKEFLSSHFNEPNILAHMRVNDRTIDGKKTLFVEEIQSDWHQAGRKKGYATPKGTLPEGHTVSQEMNADNQPVWVVRDKTGESVGFGANKDEAVNSLRPTGVPDAPFKKNWQELAMKRAIQMATEGGYDRVAFTTGKQQADRFSLSKQINDLTVTRTPTEFRISATDLNGKPAMLQSIPNLQNLDDYVGKDLANKIKDDFANKSGQEHNYSGLDLEVGGEGMKGFYDKILPDFVNKYGKKHGLKVGQADLPINAQDQIDIIKANAGRTYGEGSDAYNQALKNQYESVHYFDLTPEAKESFLSKGQPMFAATPLVAVDEETRREMLEKLFNSQK
jgi:hypothetical protein